MKVMHFQYWFVVAVLGVAASCSPQPLQVVPEDHLTQCSRVSGPVRSIESAVTRINALPEPVNVACFIASLPRPLSLVANVSVTSAQPAVGKTNPRIFIFLEGMIASVVPEGPGAALLEFGQWVNATDTLKGEVLLPPTEKLTADAPLKRILFSAPSTSCGLCHREERPHDTIDGGFVSIAFQPEKNSLVSLATVRAQHQACVTGGEETSRCEMFRALFDFGEVKSATFPPEIAFFAE